MLRQTSKRMAKEKCHDSIYSVATQRTEYRRRAISQHKIGEIMLRQGFLCWMSKPGGTCNDIKAPVATLETNRR